MTNRRKSNVTSIAKPFMTTVGGITVLEIAVLGAAGYIAWRNRQKIMSFLEEKGIDLQSIIPEQYRDLAAAGSKLLAGKFNQEEQGTQGRQSSVKNGPRAADFQ